MKNRNLIESFYNWYRGALRHPKYRWLIILGSLTYLISPFDISPDIIPFIGWIDDGVLATLLITELSALMMDTINRSRNEEAAETVVDTEEGPVIDVEAN